MTKFSFYKLILIWQALKEQGIDRNRFIAVFFKVSSYEMYMKNRFMKAK